MGSSASASDAIVCPTLGPSSLACEAPSRDFESIYEQHIDFVWQTVRRLGVPQSGLPDAVQEVLVIVHRRLESFDPSRPLRHWLYGICVRVSRREYRTRRRRQPEMLRRATPIEPDSFPDLRSMDPMEAAQHRDGVRLLYELLGLLDAEKREVFVMAELEQMTGPEMMEILELPLNTIYSRLRAARQHFERALSSKRAQMRRMP